MLRFLLKKNPIIILPLLGVVAIGIFLWQRGDFSPTPQKEEQKEKTSSTNNNGSEELVGDEEMVEETEQRSTIDDILTDIEPLLANGTKEDVKRFWFARDGGVYAEYQTREGMRMAYLQSRNGAWERAALYGAGENGWEIIEGEDVIFLNPPQEFWEYNTGARQWEKKN